MVDYCFAKRIIFVDLSKRKVWTEETVNNEDGFLGGRGINQSILLKMLDQPTDPFDEKSVIAFGAGRLVGTGAPGASRLNIDSLNPLTGGIGSSNMGGRFAEELKASGYDHIIITGKSEIPAYLWINGNTIEIREAHHLWGKPIPEASEILCSDIGKKEIQWVAIGPAGEKKALQGCIIGKNGRAAARCGLGAVMGSKSLKAIVVKGSTSGDLKTHDSARFLRLTSTLFNRLEGMSCIQTKRRLGTLAFVPFANELSAMPVRNFEDEYLSPEKLQRLLPDRFDVYYETTIDGCSSCNIKCQHEYRIPPQKIYNKVEAQSIWTFGSILGLDSPDEILEGHHLCTKLGLDIDNTCGVIRWAIDCFEKNIITKSDADGMILKWGDSETIFKLIRKIALREGIGDLLAEGSQKASSIIGKGSVNFSFTIKGQELTEPIRTCKGWALGIVVSPRGAGHTRGAPQTEFHQVNSSVGEKIWGVATAGFPNVYAGKPELVVYYERMHALLDSLGICHFTSNWSNPMLFGPETFTELCNSALGKEFSTNDFMQVGERILTLEKIFNLIFTDFDRKDDYPPRTLMKEPINSGPFRGELLNEQEWDKMLDRYYQLHGWDVRTSFPKKQTLASLGLERYFGELNAVGKLDW